jgi:hypothetical protein
MRGKQIYYRISTLEHCQVIGFGFLGVFLSFFIANPVSHGGTGITPSKKQKIQKCKR